MQYNFFHKLAYQQFRCSYDEQGNGLFQELQQK